MIVSGFYLFTKKKKEKEKTPAAAGSGLRLMYKQGLK